MSNMNASPVEVSAVDMQFNRVKDQLNQLDQVAGLLVGRLAPVLTPVSPMAGDASCAAGKAVPASPLSEEVGRVADSLESAVDYLRSILPRIEL